MAISISKDRKEGLSLTTKIFWNLLGIFFFSLLIFGLLDLYGRNIDGQIEKTNLAIQEIERQKDPELEPQMKATLTTYEYISPGLASHTNALKALDFVKNNTYKGISFSGFNYDLEAQSLTINASGKTASSLLMQLTTFQNATFINKEGEKVKATQNVEMQSFAIGGEGGGTNISISIKLTFNPALVEF